MDMKVMSLLPGVGTCENCGRAISWIATMETENGIIRVGPDCARAMQVKNLARFETNIKTAKLIMNWYKKSTKVVEVENAYLKSVGQPNDTLRFRMERGADKYAKISFVKKYCPSIPINA